MKLKGIPKEGFRRIARVVTQGIWDDYGKQDFTFKTYYRYEPGMTIEEMTKRWVERNELIDEHDFPFMMSVDELWPYREYEWTREQSRLGPEGWDDLKASMSQGWQEGSWLTLNIGRNGRVKLGEGNHRLAIAKEIGMEEVPVAVWFMQTVSDGVLVVPGNEKEEEPEEEEEDYLTDDDREEIEENYQHVIKEYGIEEGDYSDEALMKLLGL